MAEVAEKNWRRPPYQNGVLPSVPVGATDSVKAEESSPVQPVRRRTRSNSRSAGSTSTEPVESFSPESIKDSSEAIKEQLRPLTSHKSRDKYTHILILKSLNGTFETKFLVIPFKPDVLKLGRPVVNSTNNKAPEYSGNYQQPNAPQVRSDNGNFNSRVLSRNHAALCCDGSNGKIYIHDLKSSNGTFINGTRIGQSDVELKVGDVIDLGTDIDSKLEHRRISALVEDISVIPLINETVDLLGNHTLFKSSGPDQNNNLNNGSNSSSINNSMDESSSSFYKRQNNLFGGKDKNSSSVPTLSAQRAAFEAAMFGDVNNVDLEDNILGSETEILSGIFMNNSLGTSPNLINVMKMLASEIALERGENEKLKSMENFLVNYTANLGDIDRKLSDKNDKQLHTLQTALLRRLTDKNNKVINEQKHLLEQMENDNVKMARSLSKKEKEQEDKVQKLDSELQNLKQKLYEERSQNESYRRKILTRDKDYKSSSYSDVKSSSKDNNRRARYGASNTSNDSWNWKTNSMLIASAVFVGLVAYALNLSTQSIQ
ncbi:hypothetical protein Kpol_1064p56 [Vanderwaltozyma polyspora DSM 70294]|uniref:FHA domain-containing protein n=1 Tax=Vanderwaltozyma polyspora (strain ATCC 22028 / DSM 70294 / BCRC 21397 / CBS 2163 / NBRC 10782 / NRRL Y-8283 / UCD 57-17) TaxID=436907 RepID=A7TMI0_VANPO|nr:uncharacterized protein Kpol_1064p56 [Vanderwaltozyma polyspora DSM 70294]EDO16574.1 hypothetical protein Kpol_1064p56 [Vanderwaltozyma polyspora DSM 70294]